jgi:adenylate kinase family enzyme
MPERIVVIGMSGSGKTTLAWQLGQKLSLPHIEVDAIHWQAGWQWSRKQVLGHLIDSASNNHQCFVRVQLYEGLTLPGYAQDDWVAVQHYQSQPWSQFIELWLAYNRHLLHLMRRVPQQKLGHAFEVGDSGPITLGVLMADYVHHLEHHLAQIVLA